MGNISSQLYRVTSSKPHPQSRRSVSINPIPFGDGSAQWPIFQILQGCWRHLHLKRAFFFVGKKVRLSWDLATFNVARPWSFDVNYLEMWFILVDFLFSSPRHLIIWKKESVQTNVCVLNRHFCTKPLVQRSGSPGSPKQNMFYRLVVFSSFTIFQGFVHHPKNGGTDFQG